MTDGLRILSPDLARNADVPSGGTALQVSLRDGQTHGLFRLDGTSITQGVQRGAMPMGANRKVARIGRTSPDGTQRAGSSQLVFYDAFDLNAGPSLDTQKWVLTNSGLTPGLSPSNSPQGAVAYTFNINGTSASAAAGSMIVTHRFFPYVGRNTLLFRARVLHSPHYPDNTSEHGFGSPTGATGGVATAVNGAHWRKNRMGNYVPVVAMNNVEYESPPGSSAVTQAQLLQLVPPNNFFYLEVSLSEFCAVFRMQTTDGQTISEQTIFFSAIATIVGLLQGVGTFSKTHVQVFHRQYTNGVIQTTTLPVVSMIASTSVWLLDNVGPSYRTSQAQYGAGSLISPASGGSTGQNAQVANFTNSAAPAGISVSNTTATYTTLGGQWSWTLPAAGAETDIPAFSFHTAAAWVFICTGIRISGVLTATGTALPLILQWGIGFNGSAVSLATGGHMRKTLGIMSWPTGSVIGAPVPDIVWEGQEPLQPGLFHALIVKGIASNLNGVRGMITVDGYFE